MPSAIDHLLSERERQTLSLYRTPHVSLRKATRLSIQYVIGAGVFTFLAISQQQPLWAFAVFAVLVLMLALRLAGARRLARVMPAILEKYEHEIRELREEVQPPPTILSLPLLEYARVGELPMVSRSLLFLGGVELGSVPGLALCGPSPEGEIFLVYCDSLWRDLGISGHHTVDEAKRRVERMYPSVGSRWEVTPYSEAETAAYIKAQWTGFECSVCGVCRRNSTSSTLGRAESEFATFVDTSQTREIRRRDPALSIPRYPGIRSLVCARHCRLYPGCKLARPFARGSSRRFLPWCNYRARARPRHGGSETELPRAMDQALSDPWTVLP